MSETKASEKQPEQAGRRRPVWKILGIIFAVIIGLPIVGFGAYYLSIKVPEPKELATAQISHIYASDSKTELARLVPPEGNRTQVPLDTVPKYVQDAVLAAEDREFWTNSGFSVSGFSRAIVGQITGNQSAGGGSTITQQYVKNALVGDERSFTRKLKELVYSIKMTNKWDKKTILQAYLNTVYFGRNAYGIEAASQAYFKKSASELTVEEGAVLAALIQLPSQLDPWNDLDGATHRWNYVLDGMVEMGALDPTQRAHMVYPETRDPSEYSAYTEATGNNGLIKNHVIEELEAIGISEEDVTTRGLQITTTIDMQTQQSTLDAVEQNLANLQDDARAAVVSVEPGTGAIRGYYGGDDASGWDYANSGLQTGSTFKIFGLAAALQQGIPLTAQYSSAPVTLPSGNVIDNSSGTCGTCSIKQALVNSYNTSFIRLQQDLENTTQDTADMAHALGVARELPGQGETLRENGKQPFEGIVLGQYNTRPIDMAVALATVANRGVWHQPHFVQRVETIDGEVLYEHDQGEGERRVSEQVADNLLDAMSPIAAASRGKVLAGGRPSAAKTGTAQLGTTGLNKDAWMIGTTPQLSTAVWVGTSENTKAIFDAGGGSMYGSGTPATIWKQVLDGALDGKDIEYFHTPNPITYGGFARFKQFSGAAFPAPATEEETTETTEATTEETEPTEEPSEQQPSSAPPLPEQPSQPPVNPVPPSNGENGIEVPDLGDVDLGQLEIPVG